MSSITSSSLSDTLPSTVPKLDAEGDNWAIFYVRFMDAVEAKGFWGHFDGTSTLPVTTSESSDADIAAKNQWEKDKRSAKTLLTQRLPDSTVMEIHSKKSVKERWEAVVKEYTVKGAYAQTDMRAKFLQSRCLERGNARDFLRKLRLKREELAQVGVKISDEDYLSTIISSLPDALSNFASMQMSWTFQQTQQSMDANTLMTMLLQEAERQDLRAQKRKQSTGKGKEDEKDEALAVSTEKPKGKRDMSKITCWNCGDLGHFSSKCVKEKKSREGKPALTPNPKKEGTSAAAVEDSSDDEGAWIAEEVDSGGVDWFHEVLSDAEGNGMDWFEEEAAAVRDAHVLLEDDLPALMELSDSEDESGGDEEEPSWEVEEVMLEKLVRPEEERDVEDLLDTSGVALLVAESGQAAGTAELYDSGCTNHISPYRNRFENFQTIIPRHFHAANKQTFSSTGKEELVIDIPSGIGETQLRLHDVLYSAEVGYTLVSVGRLDEAGFTVKFGGGKCVLIGEDDVEIGVVPRTSTRIYKVEHEEAVANVAEERLTLDVLHRRMGHISLDAARKLLKDKMITGIRLVYSPTKDFFCASCVYAKATRKPAPKMRESERADVFGGEVHSDLWGKAPVESKGGKKFFVTFIDDKTRLTHLYLLAKKDEAAKCYKQYEAWVETQMGAKIKVLSSDRAGKWLGVDEESKGAHVYWPDNKTVTVEWNIYYENPSVNRFEEEEEPVEIVKTNVDLPAAPNPPVVCDEAPENAYTDAPETSDTETAEKRARKPGLAYWEAVKWISKYLKGTKELWLGYGGVARELVGFVDADGSMGEDRRAISGYAFIINGGAVSWSAKRQEIISLSTTESEYIAATYAAKEALWLRQLILQLFGILLPATPLFCDNQSAIALAKEHQYHARTKHINVRFHFIRWIVEDGKLRLIYCPTEEMVAHILTKALVSTKVKHFASKLGLVPL